MCISCYMLMYFKLLPTFLYVYMCIYVVLNTCTELYRFCECMQL